jgi:branched-chain amino acid transport system ATP-binding protein
MALEVTGVSAGYGGSTVLRDVSVRVGDGETVVILGPNGHGKTTLLRVISGLLAPTAGTVALGDRDLTGLPAEDIVRAGVIHIPQGDLPFPQMTVLENLLMGAYDPRAWKVRAEKLDEVFELFPRLKERTKQLAQSLSGGERRMLAIGRGLMGRPQILMIDEPSLGLSPLVIEQVYAAIARIAGTGLPVLLVDESANHVRGLADRVYIFESGAVASTGPADELLRDDALLAAYMG